MSKKKTIISIVSLIIIILLIATTYTFYSKPKNKTNSTKSPEELLQQETESLLQSLDKIVELPKGETPSIATISDKDKIKNQAFFNRAENGDKIIIYSQAKKAILYRPSSGKVVEISSISIGPTPTSTQLATPSATFTP